MKNPERLSAYQAVHALAQRELTATHLLRVCLDRIDEREATVRAWVCLGREQALAQARAIDQGAASGLLQGLPIGVKDLYDTFDLPAAYGSPIYAGHQPRADAVAVALLRQAGAIVVGKTVTTEFATFQSGPTTNPHNASRTPGGSSSGSAAAVADLMVPLATGSQTAGSIIRPAAFCGVTGYKPSFGKISVAGVKSLAMSLDTLGCFGRSVDDVALGAAAMSGDLALATLNDLHSPLRIAICQTPDWALAQPETSEALTLAHQAAQTLTRGTLAEARWHADLADLTPLQTRIMAFEMRLGLTFERRHHPELLSAQITASLNEAAHLSYENYARDLKQAQQARARMAQLFTDEFDLLIAPSAIGEAPDLASTGDPVFCRGWTLLGLPCIHLPVNLGPNGLPVGIQLIAGHGRDHLLLSAARTLARVLQTTA